MAFFITQCPHCNTSFNTSITQLHAADGVVRCGACLTVFETDVNLLDEEEVHTESISEAASAELDVITFFTEQKQNLIDTNAPQLIAPEQSIISEEGELGQSDGAVNTSFNITVGNSSSISEEITTPEFPSVSNYDVEQPTKIQDFTTHVEAQTFQQNDKVFSGIDFLDDNKMLQNDKFTECKLPPVTPVDLSEASDINKPPEYTVEDSEWQLREEFSDSVEFLAESIIAENDPEEDSNETTATATPDNRQNFHSNAQDEAIRSQLLSDNLLEKNELDDLTSENLEAMQQVVDPVQLDWQKSKVSYVKTAIFGILSLFFCGLLAFQYALLHNDTLGNTTTWIPGIEFVCAYVGCEVSEPGNSSSIRSDKLVVRSHSTKANALVVNIIFYNEASSPQPFPSLNLSFSDIDNQPVASRLFLPFEYLQRDEHNIDLLKPQSPVQVSLEIIDPGTAAVNYEVSFHSM